MERQVTVDAHAGHDGRGSDRATQWHLATASVPFAPTARDVVLICAHWLGIDDDWLRRARTLKRSMISREIRMGWIEREYWYVIQRLISNVRAIIGEECFGVLERGTKMESEAFAEVMPEIIRRKCTHMRRRDAAMREAKIE